MNIRLWGLCLGIILLGACGSGTSYRAHKKVTQGINYSHYGGNDVYYEFTSAIPTQDQGNPFADRLTQEENPAEETPAEDEDFVSENLTNTYHTYGDVVVTVASHKFNLGASASRKEMTLLMKSIETAYAKALRLYRPSGFTYAMSSIGAINPLSQVQVHCRMSERSANDNGQKACKMFFDTIRSVYLELQEAAHDPAV